jgi:two-component SAPR family response regulator
MLSQLQAISVDDAEVNLLIIEKLASKVGLNIMSFSNPLKALEYIKHNNIDIIFADYLIYLLL